MNSSSIKQNSLDQEAIERLQSFVPEKIFDAHAHLYDDVFLPNASAPGTILYACGKVVTVEDYHRLQGPLYGPDKKIRLNIILFPDAAMADRSNGLRDKSTQFLKEQLAAHPECVGEIFVGPDDTAASIEEQLIHPNIRGFKCYHVAAKNKPTWQADIAEYLPESAWQVAQERGMCITLHMVKDRALADPGNLATIQQMCRKYPNARLILAHCARAFAAWTIMGQIKHLKDYPNIYYDVSAVCESPPIMEIVKTVGTEKLLWGSDFPISMSRGKCVSVADQFLWLDQKSHDESPSMPPVNYNLVGIEGLLALEQAAHLLDLSKGDVADIFYNNAMRLFGLNDSCCGGRQL